MLPDSKKLNMISNNGLCSKTGKIVNFKFSLNDVIKIEIGEEEVIFTNEKTN